MSKEDAYMDGLLYAHLAECEAAQERQEWIDERAEELLTDPETVYQIAEEELSTDDENHETLIPELLADIVLLHSKHPGDLSGSDLLARLYQKAHCFYDQALEFAQQQAEDEYEKRSVENSYNDCDDDDPYGESPCHY